MKNKIIKYLKIILCINLLGLGSALMMNSVALILGQPIKPDLFIIMPVIANAMCGFAGLLYLTISFIFKDEINK